LGKISIAVEGVKGKRAAPYMVQGDVLVKNVQEKHIYRAKWAVGIDEAIWERHKDRVAVVQFYFPDGSVREIGAEDFEQKSFLHGDGISFARTRFIGINELHVVREAPPARGQLALGLGVAP
jgi:hypothetical protein